MGGISKYTSGRTYSYSFNPEHYGGETNMSTGDISFHANQQGLPYQNIYHEIAHSIDAVTLGYFTNNLISHSVKTENGSYIMGGLDNNNYHRNSLGYENSKIFDPIGRNVIAQQHAGNDHCSENDSWCSSGNTPAEEWADLIANYVSDNFTLNPEGIARHNWVETVMQTFNSIHNSEVVDR